VAAATGAAPIKAWIAAAAPPEVPANGAARAGLVAAVAQEAAVAVQEAAAAVVDAGGRKSSEWRLSSENSLDT
jgi:hypothetical protein